MWKHRFEQTQSLDSFITHDKNVKFEIVDISSQIVCVCNGTCVKKKKKKDALHDQATETTENDNDEMSDAKQHTTKIKVTEKQMEKDSEKSVDTEKKRMDTEKRGMKQTERRIPEKDEESLVISCDEEDDDDTWTPLSHPHEWTQEKVQNYASRSSKPPRLVNIEDVRKNSIKSWPQLKCTFERSMGEYVSVWMNYTCMIHIRDYKSRTKEFMKQHPQFI